jgi:hypothetical protein
MPGTIESTNTNIIIKMKAAIHAFTILNNEAPDVFANLHNDVSEIKGDYEMGSINILSNYFLITSDYRGASTKDKHHLSQQKLYYYDQYQSFIRKENFIAKLDRLMIIAKSPCVELSPDAAITLHGLCETYDNYTITKQIREVSYMQCSCGAKMNIDAPMSALICKSCGFLRELLGTVFDDEQFYFQEGQRTKHGTYDPSKHCRFWVERIQARETTDIPQAIIQSIKDCIRRDKIKNKNQITCRLIRKYLRDTRNSKYNEHVPLIRKIITGITPPQLTDYEMQLILIYFDKITHIFTEIKPRSIKNSLFHPYLIFKILGQILNAKKDKIRLHRLLECIHLQSHNTLIANDKIWVMICDQIPEFDYCPTDRNTQYSDF